MILQIQVGEKMKKLKNMWDNNRILIILALIILICFFIIIGVCFKYFFGANASSYGDRLDSIQNIKLENDEIDKIKAKLKESETVTDVNLHTQGKIVYIRIKFTNSSLEKAKEVAGNALSEISDKIKENYDIHFTLVEDDTESEKGFTMMGAKNINRANLIWNNNTPIPESAEE